jgi:hypothetical protein
MWSVNTEPNFRFSKLLILVPLFNVDFDGLSGAHKCNILDCFDFTNATVPAKSILL